jgi:hypothetical protein
MEGTVGYRNIRYRCYAKDSHDLNGSDTAKKYTRSLGELRTLRIDASCRHAGYADRQWQ